MIHYGVDLPPEPGRTGKLLAFDFADVPRHLPGIREGASLAGWDLEEFTDVHAARERFDADFDALVTPFEVNAKTFHLPTSRVAGLILRSWNLGVPRALLTSNPGAGFLCREGVPDTVIEVNSPKLLKALPQRISEWLLSFSLETWQEPVLPSVRGVEAPNPEPSTDLFEK